MNLSMTAEYALRAVAYLSGLDEGARLGAQALAAQTEIPPAYLSKIMRRLVVAELVDSQKGHGGGFTLTRPPEAITFAEVLAAVEPDLDPERCAFGWEACDPDEPCPLHPAYSAFKESMQEWAEGTTFASAAPPPPVRRGRKKVAKKKAGKGRARRLA